MLFQFQNGKKKTNLHPLKCLQIKKTQTAAAANENLFSRYFLNGNENPFVCQRNSFLIFIISAGN
jgi:hypothetical protein